DRILVDAPCSATGVIRRHPDIKVLRRSEDVAVAAERQAALLAALWPIVAPGGRLVYATCSILKRENSALVAAQLPPADDLAPSNSPAPLAAATAETLGAEATAPSGQRQILPGEARMDGFYYAWRTKPEKLQTPRVSISQQGSEPPRARRARRRGPRPLRGPGAALRGPGALPADDA